MPATNASAVAQEKLLLVHYAGKSNSHNMLVFS